MATYSSNTTLKMNAAVSASFGVGGIGGSGTIYTAPATGYAVVNLSAKAAGGSFTGYWIVGGRALAGDTNVGVFVGPSQTISWQTTAYSSTGNATISGVSFVNSP